jgi:hypothetical protein
MKTFKGNGTQSLLTYQSSYENGLLILNGIVGLVLVLRSYFIFKDKTTRNLLRNDLIQVAPNE